jgi:anti-sigma B factor antagonist
MAQAFDIESREDGGTVTVRVAGDLDLAASARLEEALDRLDGEAVPDVMVLDLRGVTFIDSTGLRVITTADARAREGRYELRIVRGSDPVQKLLHVTGMDRILPLVDDPDEPIHRQ